MHRISTASWAFRRPSGLAGENYGAAPAAEGDELFGTWLGAGSRAIATEQFMVTDAPPILNLAHRLWLMMAYDNASRTLARSALKGTLT